MIQISRSVSTFVNSFYMSQSCFIFRFFHCKNSFSTLLAFNFDVYMSCFFLAYLLLRCFFQNVNDTSKMLHKQQVHTRSVNTFWVNNERKKLFLRVSRERFPYQKSCFCLMLFEKRQKHLM